MTTAGGAKCWGSGVFGQLGDGTNAIRLTPVDVIGFLGVVPELVPGLSLWGAAALALALGAAYVSMRRRLAPRAG